MAYFPGNGFILQGHRGARGLRPENTLPSFEIALDAGANSLETDVHLTLDGVPILTHEPQLDGRLLSQIPPNATEATLFSSLTLLQVRECRADKNPDPKRFPDQSAETTPLAQCFCAQRGTNPFTIPTVADLLAFVQEYSGALGKQVGKTENQRAQAGRVLFDLELKRVPFHPEFIGDRFDGSDPGLLEKNVAQVISDFGVRERTLVRSFDHRAVRGLQRILPNVTTAILIANTAPISVGNLALAAEATWYCPDFRFLDPAQVQEAHQAGIKVLPWTVNDVADWKRLRSWGADGITTDFPDRLASYLEEKP